MKKIILCLSLVSILAFIACNNNGTDSSSNASGTTETKSFTYTCDYTTNEYPVCMEITAKTPFTEQSERTACEKEITYTTAGVLYKAKGVFTLNSSSCPTADRIAGSCKIVYKTSADTKNGNIYVYSTYGATTSAFMSYCLGFTDMNYTASWSSKALTSSLDENVDADSIETEELPQITGLGNL